MANEEQLEFWNDQMGPLWIEASEVFDVLTKALSERVIELAAIKSGDRVLDVGCGTGANAHLIAGKVPGAHVVATDIAPAMIKAARGKPAQGARYLVADAQVHDFGAGAFDAIVSRFGTMFFADPLAGLSNLRRALAPGGRLSMVCWQAFPDNAWFRLPAQAAVDRLGPVAKADPHAPGPAAFADADRVTGLMRKAGFADVAVESTVVPMEHDDWRQAVWHARAVGPARRIMREKGASPEDEAVITQAVETAFQRFRNGTSIAVPAAVHFYTARA